MPHQIAEPLMTRFFLQSNYLIELAKMQHYKVQISNQEGAHTLQGLPIGPSRLTHDTEPIVNLPYLLQENQDLLQAFSTWTALCF